MTSDRRKKPLAVLVDFDGTITTVDIGDQVVIKFAEPGWENALLKFKAGEINVRELWSYEISLLRKKRESEAVTYCVNSAKIRQGFREFVEYCYAQEIKIEVASSGMNFYVDSILEANGFTELPRARPIVQYDWRGRGVMVMPDNIRDCSMTALCKCDRIWRLRREGHRVIFIGDGVSDQCAVSQADIVIATGSLLDICIDKNIAHIPFENFNEVLVTVSTEFNRR
jgi:2,3-diketo-5-methylthio-1-phosphopentane phosphatase